MSPYRSNEPERAPNDGTGTTTMLMSRNASVMSASVNSRDDASMDDHPDDALALLPSTSKRRTPKKTQNAAKDIAARERKVINCTKYFLLVLLVTSVIVLTWATYDFVADREQDEFETEFENMAQKVVGVSASNVQNQFAAVKLLGLSIAAGVTTSSIFYWPYVVVPDFNAQAEKVVEMTGGERVTVANLVEETDRPDFEVFMQQHLPDIIQDQMDYNHQAGNLSELRGGVPSVISAFNITSRTKGPETRPGPYLVNWHRYPFSTKEPVRQGNNLLAVPTNKQGFMAANATRTASLSFAKLDGKTRGQIFQPIFEQVDSGKVVAMIWFYTWWESFLQNILPNNVVGLHAVVKSTCGFVATLQVDGPNATTIAYEDVHDPNYDHLVVRGGLYSIKVPDHSVVAASGDNNAVCADELTMAVYPTDATRAGYTTNQPWVFAGAVLLIFAVTFFLFLVYDVAVNRRQMQFTLRLNKVDRIVSDLFPRQIMARLYAQSDSDDDDSAHRKSVDLTSMSDDGSGDDYGGGRVRHHRRSSNPPIADLYLNSTVMYAELDGFVAWSSQRQPAEVLTLLEAVHSEFDRLARTHRVFKVESVGNSYMCCTGIPDPDPRHALHMARFARACVDRASKLTKKLEVKLGPDTGDLEVRVGLHSGQCVAGIIRVDRARFQLFGTTVLHAETMKTTGSSKRIHISEETAKLLKEARKDEWLIPRSGMVSLEGGGQAKTFWLRTKEDDKLQKYKQRVLHEREDTEVGEDQSGFDVGEDPSARMDSGFFELDVGSSHLALSMSKTERLVEYNYSVLKELLEQVVEARAAKPASASPSFFTLAKAESELSKEKTIGGPLEEATEIITLPKATPLEIRRRQFHSGAIDLSSDVKTQLRSFLTEIAALYHANEFHNYEHACHVTASVVKMLKRIVDTDDASKKAMSKSSQSLDGSGSVPEQALTIYDLAGHSYGITTDPLTQFAVVLSSIIHDADHPGVTNQQLIDEKSSVATKYKNKSVAEQNSVDLVWKLLMASKYTALRSTIYSNEDELRRFRQLIVNIVLATDICDKELGALRKNRWNLAFSEEASNLVSPEDDMDRKATIVLEHLIQASDVSHTMQHWDIYLLWNERFFKECYGAYKAGRASSDPSENWFKGEIGFFDFYIIPLARKLESCGVFGVSSDEYLGYAQANRAMWLQKGEAIVQDYLRKYNQVPQPTPHSRHSRISWGKNEIAILKALDADIESGHSEHLGESFADEIVTDEAVTNEIDV